MSGRVLKRRCHGGEAPETQIGRLALELMGQFAHLHGAFQCADRLGRLDAVHPGHLDIHQDDVVLAALDQNDRLAAIVGDIGAVSQPCQQARGDTLIDGIVLSHQQA